MIAVTFRLNGKVVTRQYPDFEAFEARTKHIEVTVIRIDIGNLTGGDHERSHRGEPHVK
jgi:hypothetical protein